MVKRQFTHVITFMVCNFFPFVSWIIFKFYDRTKAENSSTIWLVFLQFLFYSQGFILVCVRLFEPEFFKVIAFKAKELCFNKNDLNQSNIHQSNGLQHESNSFLHLDTLEFDPAKQCPKLEHMFLTLNSDINVEFVYLILEGISQFSLLNTVRSGLTKD